MLRIEYTEQVGLKSRQVTFQLVVCIVDDIIGMICTYVDNYVYDAVSKSCKESTINLFNCTFPSIQLRILLFDQTK